MISTTDTVSRARKLKYLLIAKGIKQVKIAKEAGVHPSMVTNFIHRGEMSEKDSIDYVLFEVWFF